MSSFLGADDIASLLSGPEESSARPPAKVVVNPYKDLRFLVIEDQEASRKTLRMCIQSMGGFHIDMAVSHGDAVFRIKSKMPDVIVCDYILGDGRNGQQLLEEMRHNQALPNSTVFLMVTAERSYEQVVSAVELTPDDYVIKPFSPEVLRLRIDKAVQKKQAFRVYYSLRESRLLDQAANELDDMLEREEAKPYKFEILRCRAETLATAGRSADARRAYEDIIAIHPFPWAKAGLARMLRMQDLLPEARSAAEDVIAMSPNYFEAYDLKATICSEMGDFAEAQKTLEHASARTPRNWSRKRSLSTVALHNGDFAKAAAIIREVVDNDSVGGGTLGDALSMARCALAGGDIEAAQAAMRAAGPAGLAAIDGPLRIEYECVLAVVEGPAGATRFERMRRMIAEQKDIPVQTSVDIARAALAFDDRQMADRITEKMLVGKQVRHAFQPLLGIYRLHGLEEPFRELQKKAAAKRLRK